MAKGKRTCIICGAKYSYCPNCGDGDKAETWRYLYDSELCNKIFDILSALAHDHIKKDEAKRKLEALNIPKGMKFNESVKEQIDAIMAFESKAKEDKPKKDPQIVKNED